MTQKHSELGQTGRVLAVWWSEFIFRLCIQDTSLCAAVMICATLVKITVRQTAFDRWYGLASGSGDGTDSELFQGTFWQVQCRQQIQHGMEIRTTWECRRDDHPDSTTQHMKIGRQAFLPTWLKTDDDDDYICWSSEKKTSSCADHSN